MTLRPAETMQRYKIKTRTRKAMSFWKKFAGDADS